MDRFNDLPVKTKFIVGTLAGLGVTLVITSLCSVYFIGQLRGAASEQIEQGLDAANAEYIQNYIKTTALRVDELVQQHVDEVEVLARSMRALDERSSADGPPSAARSGRPRSGNPPRREALSQLRETFVYHPPTSSGDDAGPGTNSVASGGWAQTPEGGPSVSTVWGYLLDDKGQPNPEARRLIAETSAFDIFGPAVQIAGAENLQMYFIGPPEAPYYRSTPWSPLGQTFDALYPGHNQAPFWDFFFPGAVEAWSTWESDAAEPPVEGTHATLFAPYVDAVTGEYIISIMHPLWRPEEQRLGGAVGVDIALEQVAALVHDVHIAKTGFAILVDSGGNVLAVPDGYDALLGLTTRDDDFNTPGVAKVTRTLGESSQAELAALPLPTEASGDGAVFHTITMHTDAGPRAYSVVFRNLRRFNEWRDGEVAGNSWILGFVVPEEEVLATLVAAQSEIDASSRQVLTSQLFALLLCFLTLMLLLVRVIRTLTAGLDELAHAADVMSDDFSVRVPVRSKDEIGLVSQAFNLMAQDIQEHTERLEELVAARTQALKEANLRISHLNERLTEENSRLEAELDVAKRLQAMVLPDQAELEAVKALEVAGYMLPADEVGGDYYDVMPLPGGVKLGIGDVTGHGLESGVLMLMVQSVARTLLDSGVEDPVRFLSVLNTVIYHNIQRINTEHNLTLSFIDFDGEALTVSGQHEELLISRNDGTLERIDTLDLGLPVGIMADIEPFLHTLRVDFAVGDVAVLFTDGITEAEDIDGALYGLDRLCDCVTAHRTLSAEDLKQRIIAEVTAHMGERRVLDDISLLVVKRRPLESA